MYKNSKRFTILLLVVILSLGGVPSFELFGERTAFAADFLGSGTTLDPYLIESGDQLYKIRDHLDKSFELIRDIDLIDYSTGDGWLPIGEAGSGTVQFTGSIDGKGHVIRNLKINRPGTDYVGLFGATGLGSSITNMRLENVDIVGRDYTGGLVGRDRGIIENSYVTGQVTGNNRVGGLTGTSSHTIRDSFTAVNVEGNEQVGGLIGMFVGGSIIQSSALGDVNGSLIVGGLVGEVRSTTNPITISNSFASGNVIGSNAAGFVGTNTINNDMIITYINSYASGNVSDDLGNVGFAPINTGINVINSFYDSESTGHSGLGFGTGLTTFEMKSSTTFINAGWDMVNTWAIDAAKNNGYPFLLRNQTVAIHYDKNGADVSGTSPGDHLYLLGDVIEVIDKGDLEQSGYMFMGWNTEEDGSGITYQAGETFSVTTDMTLYAIWRSTNSALANLNSDQGSWVTAYNPADPPGTTYTIHVDHATTSLNLQIEKAESNQSVSITNAAYVSSDDFLEAYTISGLNVGLNNSQIQVTAADNTTSRTYMIEVHRAASDNADLSSLQLSSGGLNPVFSSDITIYNASVDYETSSVTVTASAYDANASIQVNGLFTASGAPSEAIPLNVGDNQIFVIVTAQDHTQQLYTLTVNRSPAKVIIPTCSTRTSSTGSLILPACWGGEVSLGAEINVSIPLFTAYKELELMVSKVSDSDEMEKLLAGGEILASPIWEFTKNKPEDLLKPVTIMVTFEKEQLEAGQSVNLFYYNNENSAWTALTESIVEDQHISAEASHFTKYAVLVVDPATGLPIIKTVLTDIAGHWAEDSIAQAVNDNKVRGYPDGTFKPDEYITRAEFIVMLTNALPLEDSGASLDFTDIRHIGAWAKHAVSLSVQAGIVNGYEDGSFRPNVEITRAEMAVMIVRALGLALKENVPIEFMDEDNIPAWASNAVEAISQLGVFSGHDDEPFIPHDKITRAEAIVEILKLLERKP